MKTIRALALASFLSLALAPAGLALAQEGGAQEDEGQSAADSRATSFRAVAGPETEEVPGGGLLLGAYGTILVLLLGYVGWIARLQSTTSRDLDRLEKALQKTPASTER